MAKLTTSYYLYFFGFVFALVIHFGVATLLFFSNKSPDYSVIGKQDYYIRAELYSVADPKRKKTNKNRKEEILQARRLEEAALKTKQAKIEKQIIKEKDMLLDAISKTESPELAEEKTKIKKMPTDFLSDLDRALLQEERLWEAKIQSDKVLAYVANIQDRIIRKWSRPPTARNGMRCVLRVVLLPTGEVLQASVEESSGNEAFDNSAVSAVFRASNLPVPEDNFLFEKSFREFTLLFRPDDLRL